MTVDLHPEELLERERSGELDRDELRRLEEHVRVCTACAFERRAARDFRELLEPFAGDDALVARLVDGVTNRSRPSRLRLRRSSVAPLPRRRVPKLAFVMAAALAAGIAAAAAYSVVAPRWRAKAPVVVPSAPAPTALPRAGATSLPSAAAPSASAAVPESDVPSASPAPKSSVPVPTGSSAVADSGLDASELFARGNKARRGGSYGEAVRLYGELQRRFPGSREAHTSQLALGWLMLNQLGNPSGALGQFNGYLASGGVMSEEALSGRALALGRLGRSGEERKAWEDLLARYPGSVNAERARQRLEALK